LPTPSTPPVIQFSAVSKSYPIYDAPSDRLKELLTLNRVSYHRDFWALRDVSFDVKRGETFCIIGENGSGKSTLLSILGTLMRPSEGKHVMMDVDLTNAEDGELTRFRNRNIGFVFQFHHLLPDLTAEEN